MQKGQWKSMSGSETEKTEAYRENFTTIFYKKLHSSKQNVNWATTTSN